MKAKRSLAVIKGAGDLATGVAYRLFRCGFNIIMTEKSRPLVVRRTVALAEAVFSGQTEVTGIKAQRADNALQALSLAQEGIVAVIVDPKAAVISQVKPLVVVDAIMAKCNTGTSLLDAPLVIGLGPGFTAGYDVHAVIETCRGHDLGRVIYQGSAKDNTGSPGAMLGYTKERLLRAPASGVLLPVQTIGTLVNAGDVVAFVGLQPVKATIAGRLRGLAKAGLWVKQGMKIGDIDPRGAEANHTTISDRALAVAGGILEAVFSFLSPRGAGPW